MMHRAVDEQLRALPVAVVCMLGNHFRNLAIETNSAFILVARFLIQGVFLLVVIVSESSALC